jgi:hypothetical protein
MQLGKDGLACHLLAVLQTSLYNPTAISVNTQMLNLASESLENKRYVVGVATLDSLLDDMISVLVFDASQNVLFQFADQ